MIGLTLECLLEHHNDLSFVLSDPEVPKCIKKYLRKRQDIICEKNGLTDPNKVRVRMCFLHMCSNGGIEKAAHDALAKELKAVGYDPKQLWVVTLTNALTNL